MRALIFLWILAGFFFKASQSMLSPPVLMMSLFSISKRMNARVNKKIDDLVKKPSKLPMIRFTLEIF